MSRFGAEANHDDDSDGEPRSPAQNRAKSGFVSLSFHLVHNGTRKKGKRDGAKRTKAESSDTYSIA